MTLLLKSDQGVRVTLDEDDLVAKQVRGKNHSGFTNRTPEEMVDREVRALERLAGLVGIQSLVRRRAWDTLETRYMEGVPLLKYAASLPPRYFDELMAMLRECEKHGVYRLGHHRQDFIVQPDDKPGIVDFGNVLFPDDSAARIPGVILALRAFRFLRVLDLKHRYTRKKQLIPNTFEDSAPITIP